MAQLTQMRERIRTIETIHKITHAMRLISMSHHARLKNKEQGLRTYINELNGLFLKVKSQAADWTHPILYPSVDSGRQLIIIISSQKGLCGNFNNLLFRHIEHELPKLQHATRDTITIGKKAVDYANDHALGKSVYSQVNLSFSKIPACARAITQYIMESQGVYEKIIVFANDSKTFFAQVPHTYTLVPFLRDEEQKINDLGSLMQDFIWEQPAHEILTSMMYQCFEGTLQNLLFRSLLAEQAARFLSMDGATRNAKNLLESTRLQYNKARQAKITREIIELSEIR